MQDDYSHEVFSFYLSPMGSLVHSLHVEMRPKKSQFAVHPPVGLHALIQLLGVVKHLQQRRDNTLDTTHEPAPHLAGRTEAEVGVGPYPGLTPPPPLPPADGQPE